MTINPNRKRPEMMLASATGVEVVTKSDTVNLATSSLGIYVGGAGDITVLMVDGTTATFTAVPQGTVLPIQCLRVNSTGTTASLMLSLN